MNFATRPTLTIRGLTVGDGARALAGPLDLTLRAGEPLTLLGETGAGKSLVAQAILGALPQGLTASGEVRLGPERLDGLPPAERRALWGRRIALLPQEPWTALDPTMPIAAQVAEAAHLVAGRPRREARAGARAALEAVGLGEAGGRYPYELSGGMAQRAAFAAATVTGAEVLIADEPTKGLDAAVRDRIAALLARVPADGGTLLTITHDVALARALGGRVAILRSGRIVEEGAAAEVLGSPSSEYGRALVAAEPARWPRAARPGPGPLRVACRGLALERGGRTILRGVDLALRAGERVAVTGPSGSGKTSLLDAMAGLLRPVAGSVERAAELRPWDVQKLYQDPPSAFPPPRPLRRILRDVERRHRLPPDRLLDLLERLGIAPDLLDRRPTEVSGGELQRIALARVMALRPAAILADEPTSRLDLVTQRRLMDLLGDVAREHDLGVVLVTHDPDIAAGWAHRVLDVGALAGS